MGTPPPPSGAPFEEPQKPWTSSPAGLPAPLAGRWRRLFAGILDAIIVGIISSPFTYNSWEMIDGIWRVNLGPTFVAAVIGFLYYWLLQSFWRGQTIGKRIFGMRVVQETGQPVPTQRVAIRQAVMIILGWLCVLGLIDLAWILFDPRKQALHDKAAKTLVIDA